MDRVRIVVLAVFAAAVVGVYLVAPDDGLGSRTPTMVLLAVVMWLTDLWLRTRRDGAATSARDAAASPVHDGPDSPARSTERRPGHFDAVADAAQRATVATGGSSPEPPTRLTIDLSERPDPPVSWPPPAVQVPRVFQVSSTEALIVDLRSAPVAQPPTTQQPPAMPAAPPPPATQAQPDPWLAFAAAMFRDD